MSVFQPENIEEMIEKAKIQLGYGAIDINVTEAQELVAAQKAVQMFCDYHYDATERVFVSQEITDEDIANNYVETPKNVWNVIRILGSNRFPSIYGNNVGCYCKGTNSISSIGHYNSMNDLKGIYGNNQALITYYLESAHRSYFNSIIYPNLPVDWNRGSKRIRFLGNIEQAISCNKNHLVYEAYIVNENLCFGCENPAGSGGCFWENEWLTEYTAARIQLIWGRNLTKFQGIQVGTGLEFNGDAILQSAKEDIERLEQELFDRYSLPAMMVIG